MSRFLPKEYWPCPFCGKYVIEVIVRPPVLQAKRSRSAAAGSKTTWRKAKEEVLILVEKCPNCGKSEKEIYRKWKEEGLI